MTGMELIEDAAVMKETLKGKLVQVQTYKGSQDKNDMMGVALDPQAIRTFTIQF